ncbi:MAG: hypothetical protein NZ826_06495 [Thermodesulfovibrio sp.]|nr:hypothetical protein [Thermodesulfovibrio sp.]
MKEVQGKATTIGLPDLHAGCWVKVVPVNAKTAQIRVQIEDADGVVTFWLPVLHYKTQNDKLNFK